MGKYGQEGVECGQVVKGLRTGDEVSVERWWVLKEWTGGEGHMSVSRLDRRMRQVRMIIKARLENRYDLWITCVSTSANITQFLKLQYFILC